MWHTGRVGSLSAITSLILKCMDQTTTEEEVKTDPATGMPVVEPAPEGVETPAEGGETPAAE